jgi:hypothetical protein
VISNLLRDSDPADNQLLPTIVEYYRTEAEVQSILKECYPGTVLEGQDLLKKVANTVGLALPKTVILQD